MEIIRKKKKNISKDRLKLQRKETSDSGVEDLDTEVLRLWLERSPALVENISKIGLPRKNEQLRFVTTRSFNAIALVDFILSQEKIVECFFCVYSIDYDSGALLSMMAEQGKLGKVTFLISNLRNSAYRKKEKIVRDKFLGNPNIRLVFCGSHAKMMGFKTETNYYVVETSANFAPNSRIEQYMFENCQQTYKFHKRWIDKVDKIATARELAVFDYDGQQIAGSNKFKEYGEKQITG